MKVIKKLKELNFIQRYILTIAILMTIGTILMFLGTSDYIRTIQPVNLIIGENLIFGVGITLFFIAFLLNMGALSILQGFIGLYIRYKEHRGEYK